MEQRHLIALCWIFFLLYWIFNSRSAKPAAERQAWSGILVHRMPLWLGAILLFVPRADPFGIRVLPQTAPTDWIGVAVCLLGLAGAIWSRRTLAGNWSINVEWKQGHQLVKSGPYRLVRHPIYTALLLMCLGTAIVSGRLAAFVALVFFFVGFWMKLQQEEKLLLLHFPDEYALYKTESKALIPFVI